MKDIPMYDSFNKIIEINKGFSDDKKYCVETLNGDKLFLKISDISEFKQKKIEFDRLNEVAVLPISMTLPIDFGKCNNGNYVYTLTTWCEGSEACEVLPHLSEEEQYDLGIQAGEILSKIHTIIPTNIEGDWATRYFAVIDDRIEAFKYEGEKFEGCEYILNYIEDNKCFLKDRPQSIHHGDYHLGNMLISDDKKLSIIDWQTVDFDNYGDPWCEFNRIGTHTLYSAFSSGMIDGYFSGNPPREFWILLAYYLSVSAITSVVWAKYFAPDELDNILELNYNVLSWFDDMKNPIPIWYKNGSEYNG